MDPSFPNEQDDTDFKELDQDQIDRLLQDLNEPLKEMSVSSADDAMNIMDFVEPFLISNTDNSSIPESTPDQFTALQQDFEEFEKTMLPPDQMHPADAQNLTNREGVEDSDLMVEEMADGTLEFVMGSCQTPTQTMDLTSHFPSVHNVGGNGIGMGSFLKDASVLTYGSGSSSIGRVYYMRCSNVTQYGVGNSRRQVGMNNQANTRKRKKRKYRGVIETEQQTAQRLALTKIKNREAAARAHERKKTYEAQLQSQLPELLKKNKYLRNLAMFRECQKRMDLPPKPLRRTISGPL